MLELSPESSLARDLVAGGVFVPGEVLELNEECVLVLRNGDAKLEIRAVCVWVDGAKGSGLQLVGFDAEMKLQITALATGLQLAAPAPAAPRGSASVAVPRASAALAVSKPAATAAAPAAPKAGSTSAAVKPVLGPDASKPVLGPDASKPVPASAAPRPAVAPAAQKAAPAPAAPKAAPAPVALSEDEPPAEAEEAADQAADDDDDDDETVRAIPKNVNERLRGLSLAQQIKIAKHGETSERIILERMYSKAVWEALLHNPRITGPEVARIARMGALPRTLVELIVSNGGWLQIPEVRRALLTNPRLGTDQIIRVLRLLPKHELKLAATQTAYPFAIRDAAKRMLKEGGGG